MSDKPSPIDPTRLSVEQAARLLTSAYRQQVSVASIESDVNDGAPTNNDGSINLVHYAAWLLSEMDRGD